MPDHVDDPNDAIKNLIADSDALVDLAIDLHVAAKAVAEAIETPPPASQRIEEYLRTASNRELRKALIAARGTQGAAVFCTKLNGDLAALGKLRPAVNGRARARRQRPLAVAARAVRCSDRNGGWARVAPCRRPPKLPCPCTLTRTPRSPPSRAAPPCSPRSRAPARPRSRSSSRAGSAPGGSSWSGPRSPRGCGSPRFRCGGRRPARSCCATSWMASSCRMARWSSSSLTTS